MHLAQHAPGLVGLGNGVRRDAMQLTPPSTPVEVVSRTVSVPALAGDSDSLYRVRLILAWALVLQRERGDDNKVDQFVWGHRAIGGAETTERLSLSAASLDLSHTGTDTVSTCFEKVKELTGGFCPQQQLEWLFFNDEPEGLVSQKESSGSDPTKQWTLQLRVTREDKGALRLCGLRHGDTPLTERQVTDRIDTFIELLTIILQRPESPVRDLLHPLPRDLNQIWTWNATVPRTIERTMQDIISEQAAAHPDKVALSSWDGQWTYAELESLSTRLAHYLYSGGVAVGTIVPLCFEKSRWTIIALLAVMKAGGAFALTDPTSQPEGRLRAMVEQTGARLIVASETQSDLARKLVPNEDGEVVTVSEALFASLPSDTSPVYSLPTIPTTTSPLYIQFTSGSTGKPKGVVISHANYTSGALPRASAVGYTSSSRVFEFASYAFDVSIDCMLCTLAAGGTICIPSDADRMNDLGGAIRASGANMAHMTPSVARVLDPAVIADLDVLGLGGEAVSAADAAAWSKGTTSVIIAYGPSECTVGCTVNNTFASGNNEERKLFTTGNIGRGVGAVGWIVDPEDHDRLVPVGSIGELLIEGPVVGLGYLGEAEKTAEVFIEDPTWLLAGYGTVPGRHGRLYKTGDLVRYDGDGSGDFVFVGRKDAQVKLRGQRVELVEIEHHLRRRLPAGVKLAAEVIKPSGGESTLVAFVAEPTANQARLHPDEPSEETQQEDLSFSEEMAKALSGVDEALGADLPRYMVPVAYIPLREMPTLPSAKIDRKTLRAIGAAMTREQLTRSSRRNNRRTDSGGQPTTETEQALQRVWKALLGDHVDNISVHDSFFALGGDSLRAMKLVPAARAEGILLTVADVFRYPVLRDMAVVARTARTDEQQHTGDTTPDVVPPFSLLPNDWAREEARAEASRHCNVDPLNVEDIYPCTPLQEALMALSAKVKEAYVAQRVLKMSSLEAAERLQAAFATIAADSAILRTRIIQVPQRGLLQVVVKEPVTWRSACSLAEYLAQDRDEPMELGKPLVRYAMIREGGVAHFVLTMHHALYDGWSMPLVVDRVNQAYQGLSPRRPVAEFKHFIHYLNRTLDRAACDTYWREQLAGATGQQFPRLPFEGYQTQADSLLEVEISLEGRRLPTCPNATVTLAAVVRAAWALVASQYCSGNRDIVFGETLTGRNAPIVGGEEIEGPMITTVPVRIRIDRDATVGEYLQSVAEQAVVQIPYEHAGLQHIRRLSDDALQACELRAGFVLHPAAAAGDDATTAVDGNTSPANGLVPAGDAEAAQEALKFNTYALMLVCSLSAHGFFVMASFDSRTVDKDTMSRVLEQLRIVVHQLCESNGKTVKVGQVQCLTETERKELHRLSKSPLDVGGPCLAQLGLSDDEIEGVWIADVADYQRLLPLGAVGEMVVASRKELASPAVAIVDCPEWLSGESEGLKDTEILSNGERKARLYRTRLLATFSTDSGKTTLQILKSMTDPPKQNVVAKRTPATKDTQAVTATSTKQKTLRRIWSWLLNTDESSIYLGDSFFTLGGDSITAMKLVAEARQQGMQLSVAQVFANRTLYEMANVMQPIIAASSQQGPSESQKGSGYKRFSLLPSSLTQRIQRELENQSCKIIDVLPTRPLQEIAVRGTVELPRFSIRYELIHFDGLVDKTRLLRACQELVARNEILRTVFVRFDDTCYGVVLDDCFTVPVVEYEVDDATSFAGEVSRLDSKTRMPYGSSFVKWFFITDGSKCSLVFRLSHAQYDEMCLPIFLKQLHSLYEDSSNLPPSYPFSAFVDHVSQEGIPAAIPYWRDLLAGAPGITLLRPSTPITDRRHFAVYRTVDIAARTRDVTVATFPSAAWALTLARLTGSADIVFGEVASGRSVDVPGIPDANAIAGPCWQYVPTRVRFGMGGTPMTGRDLLAALQYQHMATSSHDCMGLDEIVRNCTDWDPDAEQRVKWFDSVVHQDVAHVEELEFNIFKEGGGGSTKARMETLYPYEEPLREWKIQAFYHAESERLTLEVVTFQSWREHAVQILDKLVGSMEQLVKRPWEELTVV